MSEDSSRKAHNPSESQSKRKGADRHSPSDRFWDKKQGGTYLCATCKKPLFKSSDKIENESSAPSFRKPISENDIQYRKIPDTKGQLGIRCKQCQSSIGYVIGGDTPHYRLNAIALDFEQSPYAPLAETNLTKSDSEATTVISKDSAETIRDRDNLPRSSAMSRLLFFIFGATVGLVAGAAGAYYFFQTFYATTDPIREIATTSAATTTPSVIEEEPIQTEEEPVSFAPTGRPEPTPVVAAIATTSSTTPSDLSTTSTAVQ